SGMATDAYAAAGANGRRSMVPLAFAAGASVAIAYSTMGQFLIPPRASRGFGLERAGVARPLMIGQLFDPFPLIPGGGPPGRPAPRFAGLLPIAWTAALALTALLLLARARSSGTMAMHG